MPDQIKTLSAALERVTALEGELATAQNASADVETLRSDLGTAQESVTNLTTERDTLKSSLESAEGERDTAQADLTAMTEERDTLKSENGTLKANAKSVEGAAAHIAATSGIDAPLESNNGGESDSQGGDLLAEYNALSSPQARDAFRRKHGAELQKLASKK